MRQETAAQFFEVFKVREESEHLVASKRRWDGLAKTAEKRKRKKLGRKAEDLKRMTSESGVPPLKRRPKRC